MNIIHFVKKHQWLSGITAVVIIVLLVYFFFIKKPAEAQTLTVTRGEFLQQVSVSGKVKATENVDLSFEQAGTVRGVYVKTGDIVAAGKFLATQDTAQLNAQYAQMQAGIELQKAKLDQLLAGATPENIQVAIDKIIAAKQDLANANASYEVTSASAQNTIYNASTVALYIKNTYFLSNDIPGLRVQDAYAVFNAQPNVKAAYDALKIIREQCDLDVYYSRVLAADKTSLDTQKTNLNTAMTNLTASQSSVAAYKVVLAQAETNLQVVQAAPRQTDVAVYQAQIKQAEAQVNDVAAQIRKKQLFAPISGTITAVNAKLGMVALTTESAVSIISAGKFQIESFVPEIYVSMVKVGDQADVTLDAYGSDKVFTAKVISIDPAQTLKDGVSSYKTKLELGAQGAEVREGMSANVVITTEKKSRVISVPQGIIKSSDGKKWVNVKNGDKIEAREVIVGEVSSNGNAEIVSGLSEGDVVIVK